MITTLIFDLDGTLSDTETLHCRGYQHALGRFGLKISDREYDDHWIRRGRNIDDYVAERGLDLDPDQIRREKSRHFARLVGTAAEAMPGVRPALEALLGHTRLVLATSSHRTSATAVLDALNLTGFFEYVAAKEDAARVKPAPDVHFHVLATLGLEPDECLVVEDSEKGVNAAVAAGIRCVAIPNPRTASHDFSQASLVLPTLLALTPALVDRIGSTSHDEARTAGNGGSVLSFGTV